MKNSALKAVNLVLLAVMSLQWTACSTSHALISYDNFDRDVAVHSDAVNGKQLGAVRGDEGGAIWNSCTDKASDSLRALIYQAKGMGANAVGNLKWYATGNSQPSCKKGWGYFLIWPFILTPLFMSTEVEGVAYKVDGNATTTEAPAPTAAPVKKSKKKHTGFYMIPDTQEGIDALVHDLVAGTI